MKNKILNELLIVIQQITIKNYFSKIYIPHLPAVEGTLVKVDYRWIVLFETVKQSSVKPPFGFQFSLFIIINAPAEACHPESDMIFLVEKLQPEGSAVAVKSLTNIVHSSDYAHRCHLLQGLVL